MAIAVEKDGIDIKGTTANVKKTMGINPRRISKIHIDFSSFYLHVSHPVTSVSSLPLSNRTLYIYLIHLGDKKW